MTNCREPERMFMGTRWLPAMGGLRPASVLQGNAGEDPGGFPRMSAVSAARAGP
jgi:hypothetical protein